MGETEILVAIKEVRDDLRDFRKESREDTKEIWKEINEVRKCQTDLKVTDARHEGELKFLKARAKKAEVQEELLDLHLGNQDVHFNKDKARETNLGYLAKKKILLIVVTAIGIIVSAITGLIVAWINGLLPGG